LIHYQSSKGGLNSLSPFFIVWLKSPWNKNETIRNLHVKLQLRSHLTPRRAVEGVVERHECHVKKCDKKAGWIDAEKLIIASDIWQPSLFSIDIKPSIGFQQQLQDHCHNPIFQNSPTEKGNQISGQNITFHQRRFP